MNKQNHLTRFLNYIMLMLLGMQMSPREARLLLNLNDE